MLATRRAALAGSLCALSTLLPTGAVVQAQSAPRPNIILIVADDMGYGDVGAYGQAVIQTPGIDRIASEGMRFTQAYAGAPVCAPSRCTLMTGLHVSHCTVSSNAIPVNGLRSEDITAAEVLKGAGYATAVVGKWGLGGADNSGNPLNVHAAPWNKGFDFFFGFLNHVAAVDHYPEYLWRNGVKELHPENDNDALQTYAQDLFYDEAASFITAHASGQSPFFLYLPVTIPHFTFWPTPGVNPYAAEPWPLVEQRYASMITYLDEDIDAIVDLVDQLGIAEQTLILFASDNGPQNLGNHLIEFFDSNGALRHGKADAYEGGIRVPFVARWTGTIPPSAVSDHVTAFWDFLPTAADLAGTRTPSDLDGISIAPTLLGESGQQSHAYLYWEAGGGTGGSSHGVRQGDWKLIQRYVLPTQLFDLSTDVAEANDVAGQQPAIVSQLEQVAISAASGQLPVQDAVLALEGDVSGSGSAFVLDVGVVPAGSGSLQRSFSVRNAATAYAHMLRGVVDPNGVTDPRLVVAAGSYAYLVDGASSAAFTVTLTPDQPGPLIGQSILVSGERHADAAPAQNAPATLSIVGTIGCANDADCDGLADAVETNTGVFVTEGDTGTDPLDADSDGDGFSDGHEVAEGSNPNDAASTPAVAVPALPRWARLGLAALLLVSGWRSRAVARADVPAD